MVAEPAVDEPVVVGDNLAIVPVAEADVQNTVGRTAEDVVPEEDVESVAILILLPLFRPELGVGNEVVEHFSTQVVASSFKLLAEVVTSDGVCELLAGTEESELLAVEVNPVGATLELRDACATVNFHHSSVERKLGRRTEVDDVINRLHLVSAAKHSKNRLHLFLAVSEGAEVLGLEADFTAGDCELVSETDTNFRRCCHLAHPLFFDTSPQRRIGWFMLEDY